MKSVILCEGQDDLLILGYYLYKRSNPSTRWQFSNNSENFSDLYKIKGKNKNQKVELYTRNDTDKLIIYSVGGKNNFDEPIRRITNIEKRFFSLDPIDRIIIVSDNDNSTLSETIQNFDSIFESNGLSTSLKNNEWNPACFNELSGQSQQIEIAPIIIPFNEAGAIETVLMNGIAEKNDEYHYIVNNAKKYVNNCVTSGKLISCLQHERLKLKAQYSSVIAITNPDRSTATYNDILMSFPWETTDSTNTHFGLLLSL